MTTLPLTVLAALTAILLSACGSATPGCQNEASAPAQMDGGATGSTEVIITTTLGSISVALHDKAAPLSVANFLRYVDAGFYDGLIFHRVISGFMVQGGGFTPAMQKKSTRGAITNEAQNCLKNRRGTLAMARTSSIHSATSQFFINHRDNAFLDHRDTSSAGFGYAVFGRVISGMEVVDTIAAVATTGSQSDPANKPVKDVIITSIRRK